MESKLHTKMVLNIALMFIQLVITRACCNLFIIQISLSFLGMFYFLHDVNILDFSYIQKNFRDCRLVLKSALPKLGTLCWTSLQQSRLLPQAKPVSHCIVVTRNLVFQCNYSLLSKSFWRWLCMLPLYWSAYYSYLQPCPSSQVFAFSK